MPVIKDTSYEKLKKAEIDFRKLRERYLRSLWSNRNVTLDKDHLEKKMFPGAQAHEVIFYKTPWDKNNTNSFNEGGVEMINDHGEENNLWSHLVFNQKIFPNSSVAELRGEFIKALAPIIKERRKARGEELHGREPLSAYIKGAKVVFNPKTHSAFIHAVVSDYAGEVDVVKSFGAQGRYDAISYANMLNRIYGDQPDRQIIMHHSEFIGLPKGKTSRQKLIATELELEQKEKGAKSWAAAHRALSSEHDRLQGVVASMQAELGRYRDELAREIDSHRQTGDKLEKVTRAVNEAHGVLKKAKFGNRTDAVELARRKLEPHVRE